MTLCYNNDILKQIKKFILLCLLVSYNVNQNLENKK
jgi:hypothetical protein